MRFLTIAISAFLFLPCLSQFVTYEAEWEAPQIETRSPYLASITQVLADINADGILDIVGNHYDTKLFAIIMGANGEMVNKDSLYMPIAGATITNLYAGDFNVDNYVDLLLLLDDSVLLRIENSASTVFSAPDTILIDDSLFSNIVIEDNDGDGDLDISYTTFGENQINRLENDGAGMFAAPVAISSPIIQPTDFIFTDIDGDNDKDILFAAPYDSTVAWIPNTGNFNFTSTHINLNTSAGLVSKVFHINVTNDTLRDIIYYQDGVLMMHEALTSSTYLAPVVLLNKAFYPSCRKRSTHPNNPTAYTCITNDSLVRDIQIIDMDNDGYNDIVCLIPKEAGIVSDLTIFWNNGAGSFPDSTIVFAGRGGFYHTIYANGRINQFNIHDFDGDSTLDISFGYYSRPASAWGVGRSTFISYSDSAQYTDLEESGKRLISMPVKSDFVDINNDNLDDIIFSTTPSLDGGDHSIAWVENLGNGEFDYTDLNLLPIGIDLYQDFGDLDNDGDVDILFYDQLNHQLKWIENVNSMFDTIHFVGDYFVPCSNCPPSGFDWDNRVILEDVDNDGDLDVIGGEDRTNYPNEEIVLFNNTGVGIFSSPSVLASFPNQGIWQINFDDFNGDNFQDVLITSNDSIARVLVSNGNGTFSLQTLPFEWSGFENGNKKVFDVDGDGDLDIFTVQNNQIGWHENELGIYTSYHLLDSSVITNYSNNINYQYYFQFSKIIDIDKDGDLDFLLTDVTSLDLIINENNTTFYKRELLNRLEVHNSLLNWIQDFDVGYINNDTVLDIVAPLHYRSSRLITFIGKDTIPEYKETCTQRFVDMNLNGIYDGIDNPAKDLFDIDVYDSISNFYLTNSIDVVESSDGKTYFLIEDSAVYRFNATVPANWFTTTSTEYFVNSGIVDSSQTCLKFGARPRIFHFAAFVDENNNGIQEATENLIPNQTIVDVRIGNSGPYQGAGLTNQLGWGQRVMKEANYFMAARLPLYWEVTTGNDSLNLGFIGNNVDRTRVYGFRPIPGIYDGELHITPVAGNINACSSNATMRIQCSNNGTELASGWVALNKVDTPFTINNYAPQPDSSDATHVYWLVDTLQQFEAFTVLMSITTSDVPEVNITLDAEWLLTDTNGVERDTVERIFQRIVCPIPLPIDTGFPYDPNSKASNPEQHINEAFVNNQETIDYTIYFQNIGTAPAVNVYLTDTLSDLLNWSSLSIIESSHEVDFANIDEMGELSFWFLDIYLPDSTSDEPNSHGYISYSVEVDSSFNLNDTIYNNARIVFDTQLPIVTNTTKHFIPSDNCMYVAHSTIVDTLCIGESYTMSNGTMIGIPGFYTDSIALASGCDSLVYIFLHSTGTSGSNTFAQDTICNGSTYTLESGTVVSTTGSYTDTLISNSGCDSIVTIELFVRPLIPITNIDLEGCDSLFHQNQWYYLSQLVSDTLGSSNGCDSIINTNLIINHITSEIAPSISACDSAQVNGNWYFSSQQVIDTFSTSNGCDSIVSTTLTIINSIQTTNIPVVTCDSALINGIWYSASQVVVDLFTSISGCDSIVSTSLSINNSFQTSNSPVTACDSVLVNGIWYYASQVVLENLTTNSGCDSTVSTNLTINNATTENTPSISACDSAEINGSWYYTSQSVIDSFSNSHGCDSIITTDLTLFESSSTSLFDTIAFGSSYDLPDGSTVDVAGVYNVTLQTVENCDSSLTINLFVADSTVGIINVNTKNINWKLYPNPASENVTLELLEYNAPYFVEIVNTLGKQVILLESNSTVNSINTKNWSPGIYYISLKDQFGILLGNKKLIITE